MSKVIDERVVSMQFDNRHFESNVKTTMSTLDKLKQKLNFGGASRGLEDINTAVQKIDMHKLGNAVDTVGLKFNAMYTIADQALRNVTTRVQHAAENIVNALAIAPIKTGFQEYETQINAVQTILANTQSKGTNIDDVNAALKTLNEYADKTIYNFTEMTRNIGTFTAAGIDLDTSVNAIQGIANLAAVSGSSSQQASTAMYQLSQALASGTVKLMDWNSVVNAGMGGQVFQDALKETARVHGIAIDAMIAEEGSFRETLSKGWLSSDILTETLQKFTLTTEGLTEAQIEANREMLRAKGYTEAQIEEIFKLGATATDAATKVKTFTQLWDVLKEAAQSGWSQTWKLIVGDFEQAKSLLTPIADTFTGIINNMSDWRNNILEKALGFRGSGGSSKWDEFIKKVNDAGIATTTFTYAMNEVANEHGISLDKMIKKHGSLAKAFLSGEISSDIFSKALKKVIGTSDTLTEALDKVGTYTVKEGDYLDKIAKVYGTTWQEIYDLNRDIINDPDLIFPNQVLKLPDTCAQLTDEIVKLSDEQLKQRGYTDEQVKALRELEEIANSTGTSIEELIGDMTKPSGREMLWEGITNIFKSMSAVLNSIKQAWQDIFPPKSVEERATKLYGLIEAFHSFTQSLIMSEDTSDKLRRTFSGLFAIIDIVSTVVGGGFKIAFEIVSEVLKHFDLNILDVTAAVGDVIVGFRDFVDGIINVSGAVEFLIPFVQTAVKAVGDWIELFKQSAIFTSIVEYLNGVRDGFADLALSVPSMESFKNLVKVLADCGEAVLEWFDTLKESKDLPGDIISGLIGGLTEGTRAVVEAVMQLGLEIIAGICKVLVIHSPSRVMFEIGGNIVEGLVNGITAGITALFEVVQIITDGIKNAFADWVGMADPFGGFSKAFKGFKELLTKFDYSKLLAIIPIAAVLLVVKRILDITTALADGINGFNGILEGFENVLKKFSKVVGAYAFSIRADGLKTLATAIAILVGSIIALTFIDTTKLHDAVGIVVILAGVLAGLAWAMGKMSDATVKIDKDGFSMDGFMSGLITIGLALLVLAATIKIVGNMEPEQAIQGFAVLTLLLAEMSIFLVATSKFVKKKHTIGQLGSTMIQFSFALMLMVGVMKLVGGLSGEEMGKGAAFATAFGVFVALLTRGIGDGGKHASKIGSMMLKLTFAMGLMVGVIKLIGLLTLEDAIKGTVFAVAFGVFLKTLVKSVQVGKEQQLAKIGGVLMAVSTAMLLLASACKLIGMLTVEDMAKGVLFATGFIILLKVLMKVLTVGDNHKLAKISSTILVMSVALGILAGVAILLGMISIENLAKGIVAVTLLGLVMAAMVKATQNSTKAVGNVVALTIAVGVMAGVIALLSMIDSSSLAAATLSLGSIMAIFALMTKVSGAATTSLKSIGSVIVMVGVIAILGVILKQLSTLPVESTLGVAASLSILLLSMSAALIAAGSAGSVAPMALVALGAITLIVAALGAILYALKDMPIETTIPIAETLSTMLIVLAGVCAIMSFIPAVAAINGALGLASFIGIMAGVLAVLGGLSKIPGFNELISDGGHSLSLIGHAIGEFVGSILGGFTVGAASGLAELGDELSAFAESIKPFMEFAGGLDASVVDGVVALSDAIITLSLAAGKNGQADWSKSLFGDNSIGTFGEDIARFAKGLNGFITNLGDFNEGKIATIECACDAIKTLVDASSGINGQAGWTKKLFGDDSLTAFGVQLPRLGLGLNLFAANLGTFDEAAILTIECACDAIKTLVGISSDINGQSNLSKSLFGDNGLAAFSDQLPTMGSNLNSFATNLGTFGEDKVTAITCAANAIKAMAEAAESLPNDGGWAAALFGENGLAAFGSQLPITGSNLCAFATNLGTFDEATVATITCAANAVKAMAEAASDIDGQSGWAAALFGDNSLAAFGSQLGPLGTDLNNFATNLGTFGDDKVQTVHSAILAVKAFTQLADADLKGASKNLSGFGGELPEFATDITSFCTNMPSAGIDDAVSNVKKIVTMCSEMATASFEAVSGFAKALKDLGSAGVSEFVSAFTSMTAKIDVRVAAKDLVDEVITGIEAKQVTLNRAAKSAASDAASALEDKYQSFYDAGSYLVEGFAAGISDNSYSAEAKAAAMANAAYAAAKEALDVNSPSKVFRALGYTVPEGFAMGIDKLGGMVAESSIGMTDTAIYGVRKSIAKIASLVNADMDVTPTIRPVLDLSDVRAGANSISGMLGVGSSVGIMSNVGAISKMMNNRQNRSNDDVVSAIADLGRKISNQRGDTYSVNGVTISNDAEVENAFRVIARAAQMERRR